MQSGRSYSLVLAEASSDGFAPGGGVDLHQATLGMQVISTAGFF